MSIIIGPFAPTASNPQFNDQLYLQSGAYVIHNPTSYQLNFKKADSNRFIVDPGTVRVVHKVGGNSGNVEWTAALVGPLAILNTPGFTIEILQQGVDEIPPEGITSLSQIATQQPRVIALPIAPGVQSFGVVNILSGSADVANTLTSFPLPASGNLGVYVFWLMITASNLSAAAGELWAINLTFSIAALTGGGVVVSASNIFSVQVNGTGPTTSPIPFTPAWPMAQVVAAGGGVALGGLQVTQHIRSLVAARTVSSTISFGMDFDSSGNPTAIPGPGGGLAGFTTPLSQQYSGEEW